MDSGKYVDMSVQNPRGKQWVRTIMLPRNWDKWVRILRGFLGGQWHSRDMIGLDVGDSIEDYAYRVHIMAVWTFGIMRRNMYDGPARWGVVKRRLYAGDGTGGGGGASDGAARVRENKYDRGAGKRISAGVTPGGRQGAPWGDAPPEFWLYDNFLNNEIRPQLPW